MFRFMTRIRISREELAKTLSVWLAVVGIKHPWMLRDLWSRRAEPRDHAQREAARRALADHLAARFEMSRHEVTREEGGHTPLFGIEPQAPPPEPSGPEIT